ncbi:hypothetical protein [Methylobacterium gnaphalii]|uniref:Uncharacterized protein n=1 Tax=Methylobacterium gnaphalii TaxID=1010610 RepID=A0A512JFX0_9HYPH|nr:hypothetical protein [Methylobacterium gnaphalii]GEP08847.1 hypothetical protein MGN01_06920 [Methylobacterium gnaphalii]GJD70370.1 hypothetical protein MMMDOFMJ_3316 [Methylobacterium gnaphalii]GLS47612.1 hypothetical protein GCM10007885_04560 [Methylobacterium gnaphalii]
MTKRTPISDRIAAQVADILAERGQALVQVRRPKLDVEVLNARLAPNYKVEERYECLSLIRVDTDRAFEHLIPTMAPYIIVTLADIHARGIRRGENREWDRHRDAAKAAGERGPWVKPPGYTEPQWRVRKAAEAEVVAAPAALPI